MPLKPRKFWSTCISMHAVKEKKMLVIDWYYVLQWNYQIFKKGRKRAKGPPPCLKQGERCLTQYSNGIYAPHAIIHHKNSLIRDVHTWLKIYVYSFTYEIFNRLGQFIFGHFVCVWGVWIALLSRCNPFRCSSSPSDFFLKKILRSFISIQIPGVALNWYFLKLSLWLTNEPYACAQNIESMNQQKKNKKIKKIQLQYIVVCINKILRQTLNKT